jgi:hypothetical protein
MTTQAAGIEQFIIDMGWEEIHEEIAKLEHAVCTERPGVVVHTGVHPTHGAIHIVVPMAGDGILLLPFVFQAF